MPLILESNLPSGGIPVLSLYEYFTQDRVLIIPPWQREYSWSTSEDEQVDTLLKDLKKFLRDKKSDEYLMGSVVLCTLPSQPNRPLLIDGQQRTLTLSLLLMCCQKFLRTNNLIDGKSSQDTALDSMITECINSNAFGTLQSRVEMKRSDADQTIMDLYNWSIVPGYDKSVFKEMDRKNPTQKNLINSVEYIYGQIAGNVKINKDKSTSKTAGNWLELPEFKSGLYKLLKNVKLIQIQVSDKRESISVFDHINNRGMALNPSDLIKNLMFEHVQDQEFDVISTCWNEMLDNLTQTKKSRLQDPRYLLRSLSHIDYGAHESYDDLDVFWAKKFSDYENSTEGGISAINFAKKLPKYSEALKYLVTRSSKFQFPLNELYLSGEMGSVQHYSVMLAGIHLNSGETFQALARQVNARTLLYMLAQERTQLFDALIPEWAHAVKELKPDSTKQDLAKVYLMHAQPDESVFDDLRERMFDWDYTNASQKKKIRAVLAYLSVHLNKECRVDVRIEDAMRSRKVAGESHPWEIEHVMPQSMDKSRIYQTIGNLVLLSSSDNNDASGDAPHLKKEHYKACSLLLTRTLNDEPLANSKHNNKVEELFNSINISRDWSLDSWDEESVESRTNLYFEYLKQVIKSVTE